jgi:VanZ family protein
VPANLLGRGSGENLTKSARLILDFSIIFGYSAFLFVILCAPHLRQPRLLDFPHSDKVIHACQFAVLSFLICRFFLRHRAGMGRFRIFISSVLISAGYGAVTELIQKFVPGRTADVADAGADAAGAILAASVLLLARQSAGRKSQEPVPEKLRVGQKE